MIVLTITPAELWGGPAFDAVYTGFDSNLLAVSGDVRVAHDRLDINREPNQSSTVNFATTLRRRVITDVVVTLLTKTSVPFRIGVWSPWTGTGYFVIFGADPNDDVDVQEVKGGKPSSTLVGGTIDSQSVGRYQVGSSYRVVLRVDRTAGTIQALVSGPGVTSAATLTQAQSPALFTNVQIAVDASMLAGQDSGAVELTSYSLALPRERSFATRSSWIARAIEIALLLIGGLALLGAAALHSPLVGRPVRFHLGNRSLALASGAALVYLVGISPLFGLPGHPFDFGNEKLHAYIAHTYGPAQLFFLPAMMAAPVFQGTVPWVEAAFPYGAVFAYLSAAVGWISSVLSGGAALSRSADEVGYVIKVVNAAFGLADGILIYSILRKLDVGEKWSRVGGALFLFNPAVLFNGSVWGQTHAISIFLVLLAILFAERGTPTWAWLALFGALLTRPQMLVFGLLLGVALIRKFPWRENLMAVSWSVIGTFILLAPLTLATSPSLPVDVLLNDLRIQQAGGNPPSLSTVSQSAFSLWPLVTYIAQGASGLTRAFLPSTTVLVGNLTYQRVSQILTLFALLVITLALLRRKRADFATGGYFPLLTIGVMSFLMLFTGVVATHFLLALPLLLLCKRWMDPSAYFYAATTWTITMLVPMWGEMGTVLSSTKSPLLASVTQFFVGLYQWDRFITVAVVANICAVVWLTYRSWLPVPSLGSAIKVSRAG